MRSSSLPSHLNKKRPKTDIIMKKTSVTRFSLDMRKKLDKGMK